MTKFKKQIFAVASSGVILLNMVVPAFAETAVVISGNGDSTYNNANVVRQQSTTVAQSNTAKVSNNVDSDASTGGNRASRNTGGDVLIDTGNAYSRTEITNDLNANSADVSGCGTCEGGDVDILIKGNGVDSKNSADVKVSGATELYQTNAADVRNNVDSDAKTGNNDAKRNTGGDVEIFTGDAKSVVFVDTEANRNVARIGARHGHGQSGDISVEVSGNGDSSETSAGVTVDPSVVLVQENEAYVSNDVDSDAKTGGNRANRNTGGDTLIDTGNAWAETIIDNAVNFNAASIDCECLFEDVFAKIAGNGVDSKTDVNIELGGDLDIFQENAADLYNDADNNAKTGKNKADRNTGDPGSDPAIFTGDAGSKTILDNSGNVNVYGPHADVELPGGVSLDLHFDLSDLMGWLHM